MYLRESGVVRPRTLGRKSALNHYMCRSLNVSVAAFFLLVLSPLMLFIAAAVKLGSRGAVLYEQPRVGLDRRRFPNRGVDAQRARDYGGRIFTMYKFRSMVQTDSDSPQVWAEEGDARITRVGRVLRLYRLDELPQLWNVLTGDMNMVGPRPEQPEIFLRLCGEVRYLASRQRVLPGITGLAQVHQHYDRSIEDVRRKADLDWEYIRRRSPLVDLEIMARTVPTIVMKRGA